MTSRKTVTFASSQESLYSETSEATSQLTEEETETEAESEMESTEQTEASSSDDVS